MDPNAGLTELKFDYDKILFQDVELIFEHRGWLLKYLQVDHIEVFTTRRGYHVRAFIKTKLSDRDILLVQILMGSDIQREIYDWVRLHDGKLLEEWNKLYTKKFLVLGTRIATEIGGETFRSGLTEKLSSVLNETKDLSGFI